MSAKNRSFSLPGIEGDVGSLATYNCLLLLVMHPHPLSTLLLKLLCPVNALLLPGDIVLSGFSPTLPLAVLVAKAVFDDVTILGIDLFKGIRGPGFQQGTIELGKHLRATLFRQLPGGINNDFAGLAPFCLARVKCQPGDLLVQVVGCRPGPAGGQGHRPPGCGRGCRYPRPLQ